MHLGDAGARATFVLHDRDATFTPTFECGTALAGARGRAGLDW